MIRLMTPAIHPAERTVRLLLAFWLVLVSSIDLATIECWDGSAVVAACLSVYAVLALLRDWPLAKHCAGLCFAFIAAASLVQTGTAVLGLSLSLQAMDMARLLIGVLSLAASVSALRWCLQGKRLTS